MLLTEQDVRVVTPADASKHFHRPDRNHKARGRLMERVRNKLCTVFKRDLCGSTADRRKRAEKNKIIRSCFPGIQWYFFLRSVPRPSSSLPQYIHPSIQTVLHQQWAQHVRIFPSYPLPPFPLRPAGGEGGGGGEVRVFALPTTTAAVSRRGCAFCISSTLTQRQQKQTKRSRRDVSCSLSLISTSGVFTNLLRGQI